jgi:hypothetical protein
MKLPKTFGASFLRLHNEWTRRLAIRLNVVSASIGEINPVSSLVNQWAVSAAAFRCGQ